MISEFPLFIFTTLGGIAAGAYVARAIEPLKVGRTASWAFPLFALALLAVSGFALLGHLGQPLRVLNAFSNPAAGITQEGIVTVLFGVAVVADFALCLKRGDSPALACYRGGCAWRGACCRYGTSLRVLAWHACLGRYRNCSVFHSWRFGAGRWVLYLVPTRCVFRQGVQRVFHGY